MHKRLTMALAFLALSHGAHAGSVSYTYDRLSRFTNAAYSDGSVESYTYDGAGNRLSRVTLAAKTKVDNTPPSVPANLVTNDFTTTQVRLNWGRSFDTGGSGLLGYRVYLNGSPVADTTATSFLLTGLLLDTDYWLTVAAYDRYTNISAASPPLYFVIPSGIDRRPPLLTVLFPTNNAVFFTNLISVTGTATDAGQGDSGIASVTANGLPTTGGTASGATTSEWSLAVSLLPGYNPFRVIAEDGSTNQNRTTNEFVVIRGIPTNEAPLILFNRFVPEGFQVGLAGTLSNSYTVWASSNLLAWFPLTNLLFGDWLETLLDTDAAHHPVRFYRFSAPTTAPDPGTNAPALLLQRTGMPVPTTAPALGDNGYLYTTTEDGVLAIRPDNLQIPWGPTRPAECRGFPKEAVSIASNGTVFAVGDWNECGNGQLAAFDPTTGAVLWQNLGGGPHPRHVAAIDDSIGTAYHGMPLLLVKYLSPPDYVPVDMPSGGYYIGDRGIALDHLGNIYMGMHGGAGRPTAILSLTTNGNRRWVVPITGDDGPRITAISEPNILLAYHEAADLLLAWEANHSFIMWTAAHCHNPVVAPDGAIYCNATTNGELVALTAAGQERWRRAVPGLRRLVLDLIDASGTLYAHGTNRLVALSSSDGSVRWSFEAESNIVAQVTIATGGRLFLADQAGSYYLLETQIRHASSSWPIALYGNRRHTMKAGDNLPVPGLP